MLYMLKLSSWQNHQGVKHFIWGPYYALQTSGPWLFVRSTSTVWLSPISVVEIPLHTYNSLSHCRIHCSPQQLFLKVWVTEFRITKEEAKVRTNPAQLSPSSTKDRGDKEPSPSAHFSMTMVSKPISLPDLTHHLPSVWGNWGIW